MLYHNIKTYVKGSNFGLTLKIIKYKPYGDLKPLFILKYYYKNFFIDFVTNLPISADCKKIIITLF